jgi:hypothetical protein
LKGDHLFFFANDAHIKNNVLTSSMKKMVQRIAASRKAAKKLKKAVSISNSKQKNIQSKEGESVSTLKIKSRSIW